MTNDYRPTTTDYRLPTIDYRLSTTSPLDLHTELVEPTLRDVTWLMVQGCPVVGPGRVRWRALAAQGVLCGLGPAQADHSARVERVEHLELAQHTHSTHREQLGELQIELVQGADER